METHKRKLLIGSGAVDALVESLPADKADALLDRVGVSANLEGVIRRAIAESDARWRRSMNDRWFATARSQALEPWRYLFESDQVPGHQVELELFSKGDALLTQTYRGKAATWSLWVGPNQIEFNQAGLADIDADTVQLIAEQAQLGPVFREWTRWKGVFETLKRFGETLDSVQRNAVRSIASVAAEMGKGFLEVAQWLYFGAPEFAAAGNRALRGEEALGPLGVVVTDLEAKPRGELRADLAWVGPPPAAIEKVLIRLNDNPSAASRVEWSAQGYASLRVSGLDLDNRAKASASWDARAKTLELKFVRAD